MITKIEIYGMGAINGRAFCGHIKKVVHNSVVNKDSLLVTHRPIENERSVDVVVFTDDEHKFQAIRDIVMRSLDEYCGSIVSADVEVNILFYGPTRKIAWRGPREARKPEMIRA